MLTFKTFLGPAIEPTLDTFADLRIKVFREWPYLYEGDRAYEREYAESYRCSPSAILVGAFDQDTMVGAATGMPLEDHADNFSSVFDTQGFAPKSVFYCAESVLLPRYRGQGAGHRFFDLREAHARKLGRPYAAFCAVVRDQNDSRQPENYRPLDEFWRGKGYLPLDGAVARFDWKDIGEKEQSTKELAFWTKTF